MLQKTRKTQRSVLSPPKNQSIKWYRRVIDNNGLTDPIKGKAIEYDMSELQDILNMKLERNNERMNKDIEHNYDLKLFKQECIDMIKRIRDSLKEDLKQAYNRGYNDGITRGW